MYAPLNIFFMTLSKHTLRLPSSGCLAWLRSVTMTNLTRTPCSERYHTEGLDFMHLAIDPQHHCLEWLNGWSTENQEILVAKYRCMLYGFGVRIQPTSLLIRVCFGLSPPQEIHINQVNGVNGVNTRWNQTQVAEIWTEAASGAI